MNIKKKNPKKLKPKSTKLIKEQKFMTDEELLAEEQRIEEEERRLDRLTPTFSEMAFAEYMAKMNKGKKKGKSNLPEEPQEFSNDEPMIFPKSLVNFF